MSVRLVLPRDAVEAPADKQICKHAGITEEGKDSQAAMDHAFKWILIWGGILSVVLFILWPCLALPARVFSKVRLGSVPLHASCCQPLEQSAQQADARNRLLATAALGH